MDRFRFNRAFLVVFLIGLLTLIFYSNSLKYFFSQDDFIHLYSSRPTDFIGFLNFFNPFYQYPDIFFFRPLSTQLYFFVNYSLFGLNSTPFHITALLFHISNGLLAYFLVNKLWKNKKLALITALCFSVSSVHFLSIYYISAFQQILKTFFILLTVNFYINYLENKKKRFLISSSLTFVFSLLSKETAVITPILILALAIYYQGFRKKVLWDLVVFGVITVTYLLLRFVGFQSIFGVGDYKYSFEPGNILQNLKWYLLWVFGLPEIISTYPSLNPTQFYLDFPQSKFILGSFLILLTTIFISLKNFLMLNRNLLLLSLVFIIVPILPVIILVGHNYPQYLDLSLMGVYPVLGFLIFAFHKFWRVASVVFLSSFLILQYYSINLSENTHWTTHRSAVANFYYQVLKEQQPNLNNKTLIFTGKEAELKEISVALAKSYGPKLFYPSQVKDVIYSNSLKGYSNGDFVIQRVILY